MDFNQIIMYIMAFGAALGGIDCILGNRLGFGERFEEGFRMLGPVALSMAGIICLAPLLSSGLGVVVRPLCKALHLDPGIFGSILAIDMGGYSLSLNLAADPEIGRFSGIIVSSILGCTIVFSIPVGLGFLTDADRPHFMKGILLGLAAIPFALTAGGLVMGLSLRSILWNSLPILLLSLFLGAGIICFPQTLMTGFLIFARLVRVAAMLGLTLGAIDHMTGISIFSGMSPLPKAMEVICSICITALGSMPLAALIQRIMKVPFQWIGERIGLNSASTTALLLGLVSATPALAMIPEMNKRGKVVITASLVSCISVFGAHFAFTGSCEPDLVPAVFTAKLLGGLLGGIIAMFATRNIKES